MPLSSPIELPVEICPSVSVRSIHHPNRISMSLTFLVDLHDRATGILKSENLLVSYFSTNRSPSHTCNFDIGNWNVSIFIEGEDRSLHTCISRLSSTYMRDMSCSIGIFQLNSMKRKTTIFICFER